MPDAHFEAHAALVPHGLYVLTDPALTPPESIVDKVRQAILGGARMVQLRDKPADHAMRRRHAAALLQLCDEHRVPMIINDDVELARAAGAHGVHLGKDDMSPKQARAMLGARAIVGVSCYNDFHRAEAAYAQGADYIAFGSFFPSAIKPEAPNADTALLQRARRALSIPICAVGGITAENAAPLIQAGATLLAVISGVFAQPDPTTAASRIASLFAGEK